MDRYITGAVMKHLREEKGLTQAGLASLLGVSDKTVSKWETGKGYPDITLLEPIAGHLGISVVELLSGLPIQNQNKSFNIKYSGFYVCPICGNVVWSTGETLVCCHGITLPKAEAEPCDGDHMISVEPVEDDYYVTVNHEMSKSHHISFLAAFGDTGVEIVKLYPEGNAEARFKRGRTFKIFAFCNHHGLFEIGC